jgi:hypothetical protein
MVSIINLLAGMLKPQEVFEFACSLAKNLKGNGRIKQVCCRMSVRMTSDSKRSREEFAILQDALATFDDRANVSQGFMPWAPYRSPIGRPQTQWGAFASRKSVEQESAGPIQYPAHTSFSNTGEAAILSYGAYLEHLREFKAQDGFSRLNHRIGFVKMADSGIAVIVKFTQPNRYSPETFRIKEGSIAEFDCQPPIKRTRGSLKFKAISIPNVFNLAGRHDSVFVVLNQPYGFLAQFAVESGREPRWMDAKVKIRIPSLGAQRQVDAVNRLCHLTNANFAIKWHKVLLNQYAGRRTVYDPTDCLNLESSQIDDTIRSVLEIPGIEWAEDQKKCIKACRHFPERILIVEGFPGTGKTYTLVAMAYIYLTLGMHVIVSTPSHFAADAFCETVDQFNADAGAGLEPLRVYRPMSELRAYRSSGFESSEDG